MIPPRGFVLGKFMPPHAGHVFLCTFAQSQVNELAVLVCSLPDDAIPGALRADWMRQLFPGARVLWCNEVLPQAPEDDPANFWPVWRDVVHRHHPEPIDVVFASETYGARLAQEVGARFAPCDPARHAVPISATAIRNDPIGNWRFIPEIVRPHFARRVCLMGPESSGKTTLAHALAQRFDAALAPEYGRTYTETLGVQLAAEDLICIAIGQTATAKAAARVSRGLVIEDTDAVLTGVWSDMLLGARDAWFDAFADYADLYLLCDIDFAWVDDGTRYFAEPAQRRRFFALCKQELEARSLPYILISGDPDARVRTATAEIERLLGGQDPRTSTGS